MPQHAVRRLIALIARSIFALRYRVEVRGLEEVRARGERGILFLPNHLALIDPAILTAVIEPGFHPRPLADEYQVTRPIIRWVVRQFNAIVLPNMERRGSGAAAATRVALEGATSRLRAGDNLLFYPAGRLRHRRVEEIRAASGTEIFVKAVPDARLVLVRQTGLWGSRFSRAHDGRLPHLLKTLARGAWTLLLNGLFFTPRRHVLIEFEEPADFPRHAGRMVINRYLEDFYNLRAPHNTYVPYHFWEKGGTRELPEPDVRGFAGDPASVPEGTREIVFRELARISGRAEGLRLEDRLAQDLGIDSLGAAEIVHWVEGEFGSPPCTPESLVTVGDVVLAAAGKGISAIETSIRPASGAWRAARGRTRLQAAAGSTVNEVFLNQAARGPARVVLADQPSGEKSYREIITGLLLLVPMIRELPGQYVGVMLPASVGAGLFFLAVLFAGKTPVMVNWTTGSRNIAHALDLLGVERVITAGALLSRLATLGIDLSALSGRFVLAEDLRGRLRLRDKLLAVARARLDWRSLRRGTPPEQAVILFTSGSENLPKAVPLTHTNLLTNVRDVLGTVPLYESDALIGMLPPFHSFGITMTTLLPLCCGLRTVYHPNPTEAAVLARVTEAYRVTMLVGTPTFLHGVVRTAEDGQLSSLRLAVTGAEKCPETVRELLRQRCPQATIHEGYGITECSPVVSITRPDSPDPGIGPLLPSIEGVVVGVESGDRVAPGATGMLLVRGASVFSGYLNHQGESPFVSYDGRLWYRTGDLVRQDAAGTLFFEGRLKRFVKLGGEMISLPAIEAVLIARFAAESDEGPPLAVEAIGHGDSPEIVVFTPHPLDRDDINRAIREAGLSALHHVRRVIRVEAIPVLGTGKTDYRGLKDAYERQLVRIEP